MITPLQPGLYVLAVSGGVDSIVLLDVLAKDPNLRLVVAHFDHGIRAESSEDRRHVAKLAADYKLPFVYEEGLLGAAASENTARLARYDFLRTVQKRIGATSIVTAHHQDDVIETALLNVMRGTHRKGMSSLQTTDGISRPLLSVSKKQLRAYAQAHGLEWREDRTNTNTKYTRNALRVTLRRMTPLQRQHLLAHIRRMQTINTEMEELIANHLHIQPASTELDRRYIIRLPFKVTKEIMAAWLRKNNLAAFDARTIQRLAVAAKTSAVGKKIDVYDDWHIVVGRETLALKKSDR